MYVHAAVDLGVTKYNEVPEQTMGAIPLRFGNGCEDKHFEFSCIATYKVSCTLKYIHDNS